MRPSPSKRSKLPLVAGSFAIIAACICAFLGIISLFNSIHPLPYAPELGQPATPPWSPYPLWTVLGLLGFASGMAGGILTLKRKMFNRAMAGILLMIPASVALPLGLFYWPAQLGKPSLGVWVIVTPVILLTVLSIIFATMSRKEFTS